jgi:hypothetical protein
MLEILTNAFKRGSVHPLPEASQNKGSSKIENDAIRYSVFLSVSHKDEEALYWATHIDVHLRAAGLTVFWNEHESMLVDWQSAIFNCITFMPILSSNTFVNPLSSDDFNQCLLECEVASVLFNRNTIKYYAPVFVGVRKVLSCIQTADEDGSILDIPVYDDTVQEFNKWPEHVEDVPLEVISDVVGSVLSEWAVQLEEEDRKSSLQEIISGLYSRDISAIFGDPEACERALQIVVEMTRNAHICCDEGFDIVVMVEAEFFHRVLLSDLGKEAKPNKDVVENFMQQLQESGFLAQLMIIDSKNSEDEDSEFVNIAQSDVITPDQAISQFSVAEFAKTKAIVRILCPSTAWDDTFQYFDQVVLSNLHIRPVVFEAVTEDRENEDFSIKTTLDIRREGYVSTSFVLKQALIEAEKRINVISSQNPRRTTIRKVKIAVLSAFFIVLAVIIAVIATQPKPIPEIIPETIILGPCATVKTNCHKNALCLDKIKHPQMEAFTNASYSYSCVCDQSKGFYDYDSMGISCIYPLQNVSQVALESFASCAKLQNGQLYCWGLTFSKAKAYAPALFPGISNIQSISLGPLSACALKTDGSIWCWGIYNNQNLGNGISPSTATPTRVQALQPATSLCVTIDTACAITASGVTCWGATFQAPTELISLSVPKAVACGSEHVCILRNDRTVMCSG